MKAHKNTKRTLDIMYKQKPRQMNIRKTTELTRRKKRINRQIITVNH